MRRKTATLLCCAAAVICTPVIWQAQQPDKGPQDTRQASEALRFVQRISAVEEIKPRTDDDRARARLFDSFGAEPLKPGANVYQGGDRVPFATAETPTYNEVVKNAACSAALIVVGTPTPRRVRMNEKGSFLFTEYTLSVRRWIAQTVRVPARDIEFLKPGGEVSIGDTRIVATAGTPLLRNTEYMFFLRPVPNTGAFVQAGEPIPPKPQWDQVLPYTKLPAELKNNQVDFETFAIDVAAAARVCTGARQ